MPKQLEISGTERPKIKAIETAAEDYVDARDKRMALTKKEVEARTKLIDTMHKHEQTNYVYGDMQVILKPGQEGVRVRPFDDGEADDLENEDD